MNNISSHFGYSIFYKIKEPIWLYTMAFIKYDTWCKIENIKNIIKNTKDIKDKHNFFLYLTPSSKTLLTIQSQIKNQI